MFPHLHNHNEHNTLTADSCCPGLHCTT